MRPQSYCHQLDKSYGSARSVAERFPSFPCFSLYVCGRDLPFGHFAALKMDSQLLGKSDKDAILANTRVQITPINESPTENVKPLRDGAFVPQGWPQEPRAIAQSCTTRVLNIATDIILLGLSLLFLIVAFIARSYNDTYVDDHPAFARALNQATLFVSRDIRSDSWLHGLLTYGRVPQSFLSSLQSCSVEPHTVFFCGVCSSASPLELWIY